MAPVSFPLQVVSPRQVALASGDEFSAPDQNGVSAMPIDGGGGGYCLYPDCEPSPKKELAEERLNFFRKQTLLPPAGQGNAFLDALDQSPFLEYAALTNPPAMARLLKEYQPVYGKYEELERRVAEKMAPEILLNKALSDLTRKDAKPALADLAVSFLSWYLSKDGKELEKVVTQKTEYEQSYDNHPRLRWLLFRHYTPRVLKSRRYVFEQVKKAVDQTHDFSRARRAAAVLANVALDGDGSGFEVEASDFLFTAVHRGKSVATQKAVADALLKHDKFNSSAMRRFDESVLPHITALEVKMFVVSVFVHPRYRLTTLSLSESAVVAMALEFFPQADDLATATNFVEAFSEILGPSRREPSEHQLAIVESFLQLIENPSLFAFMRLPHVQTESWRLLEAAVYALVKYAERLSDDALETRLVRFAKAHRKEDVGRFAASLLAPHAHDEKTKRVLQSIAGTDLANIPPYRDMFSDNFFRARLYFLDDFFFSERWKRWLGSKFGTPKKTTQGYVYRSSEMQVDVVVGRGVAPINLFETVDGPRVDYRGYFGHAGGGAELRGSFASHGRDATRDDASIVQVSACGSLHLYGPAISRLYPRAQVIGTRATTWEPTNPRYFAAVVEGIEHRKSWVDIRSRTKAWRFASHESAETTVFPDEAAQLGFRDSDNDGINDAQDDVYNLGAQGPPPTRDDYHFLVTSREPTQGLGEVVAFLRARFSTERRLRPFADLRLPLENQDGFRNHGWFRHRLDHQDFLKGPVEQYDADHRMFFEFEINAGYQLVSPLLLKVATYYELGSHFLRQDGNELTEDEKVMLFLRAAEAIFLEADSTAGQRDIERYQRAYQQYRSRFSLPAISFQTAHLAYKSKEFSGSERTPDTDSALEEVKNALRSYRR